MEALRHEIHFMHLTDEEGIVSSIAIQFQVLGEHGMVSLNVFSGWGTKEKEAFAGGVAVHTSHPLFDGQAMYEGHCDYVPGGKCYGDLSTGVTADPIWKAFLEHGETTLWDLLDTRYLGDVEEKG